MMMFQIALRSKGKASGKSSVRRETESREEGKDGSGGSAGEAPALLRTQADVLFSKPRVKAAR